MLKLLDAKRTGALVTGKSGTAKSLAYAPSSGTLYVLHSFGPDHLRLMSVDNEGRLTLRLEQYSVAPQDKPGRLPVMVVLSIAKDPACPMVPGDGTFRGLADNIGSSPNDNWLAPEGAYLYQIYANACKLVGCAVQPDGSLEEFTSATIPYNSPQGLAGF